MREKNIKFGDKKVDERSFYKNKKLFKMENIDIKATATDMRYFTRSKFFRGLVHKKNFSLI